MIIRIEINQETGDATFFFHDSGEPWSSREFVMEARKRLIRIEETIAHFNALDKEP